jgi:predicted XRE-type DNA-binding protein
MSSPSKKAGEDDFAIMRGSGNLFADMGHADAAAKKLKSQVAAEIIAVLDARKLSVRAAAALAKSDPADIQRIRSADLSRFTLDRLVRIAGRLGKIVEIRMLDAVA